MAFNQDLINDLVSNCFGTLLGVLLGYWFSRIQANIQSQEEASKVRTDKTVAFYEELVSSEFCGKRIEASTLLEHSYDYIKSNGFEVFWKGLQPEKKEILNYVMSYFRRLSLSIEYKQVDEVMVFNLISGEFSYWYSKWLKEIIPSDWETRKRIDFFEKWRQGMIRDHQSS